MLPRLFIQQVFVHHLPRAWRTLTCQIHLRCCAAAKQRVAIIDKSYASQEIDAKSNVIVNIEIIDIPQTELERCHYYSGRIRLLTPTDET